MIFQLPNTVKVGAIVYEVSTSRNALLAEDGASGDCNYMEARIAIRDDRPVQIQKQLFVHELVHAIIHATGLETNEIYNDENLIRPVANMLLQVFLDNDFTWIRNNGN